MGVLLSQFGGTCTIPDPPPPPPEITLPFIGKMQKARKSLYAVPDGAEMWLRFMDSLELAMAPARQFIELLELAGLYKDCLSSIINAVMQLNPDPIVACLKKVVKKITTLMSFFPPISYVRLVVDYIAAVVQMLDEIILFICWLDSQITSWRALVLKAQNLGDTTLLSIADCEISEYGMALLNANDILKLVIPCIRVPLEPMIENIPSAPLKYALNRMIDLQAQIEAFDTAYRAKMDEAEGAIGIDDFLESLGSVLDAVVIMADILVDVYNIVGPLLGKDPLRRRSRPGTVNF